MEAVLFFLAAIGALGGAIGVVAMRNPFYSVLALVVHLFSLAALFLLLTSAFVAAAQREQPTHFSRPVSSKRWSLWRPRKRG